MGLFGGLKGGFNNGVFDLSALPVVAGAPTFQPATPVTPGMFGGAAATRSQTATAAAVPSSFKPSIGRVLNDVLLGSDTPYESIDRQKARAVTQAQQQLYVQQVRALHLAPDEELLALNSPEKWMEQRATRSAFHDVAGGHTYTGVDGAMTTAPLLTDHEGVYGVQDANGYHQTGQAGISTSEQTTKDKVAAEIQNMLDKLGLDRDQLAEAVRSHKVGEQIGFGNLGVARQNAGTSAFSAQTGRMAENRAAGAGAPPATGGAPDLAAIGAELARRRQLGIK